MISQMTSRRTVTVNLAKGLHLVPCSRIVEYVRDFKGDVKIIRDDTTADAKSIFDLMTLAAPQGTALIVEANGEDADKLADGLERLFANDFEPDGPGT